MKKVLTVSVALMLVLALFAGCGNAAEAKALARGSVSGSTYTNEYAGITFEAPNGWTFASDEELAELMQVGTDVLKESGANFNEAISDMQVFFDMQCADQSTGDNVIIQFENLKVSGSTGISAEDYIDLTKGQLEGFGITSDMMGEIGKTTLGGNEYTTWGYELGGGAAQKMYMYKTGDFMISIIITAAGTGMTIDEISANIK